MEYIHRQWYILICKFNKEFFKASKTLHTMVLIHHYCSLKYWPFHATGNLESRYIEFDRAADDLRATWISWSLSTWFCTPEVEWSRFSFSVCLRYINTCLMVFISSAFWFGNKYSVYHFLSHQRGIKTWKPKGTSH